MSLEQGTVTSVTYRDGGIYCDVRSTRNGTVYEDRPVYRPASSFLAMPKQGMAVSMEVLNDGTRIITDIVQKEQSTPDSMEEGEFAIQLDNNTKVQFKKQSNGSYDLTVSASGTLNLEAESDINMSSGGDINLNSGGSVYINGSKPKTQ